VWSGRRLYTAVHRRLTSESRRCARIVGVGFRRFLWGSHDEERIRMKKLARGSVSVVGLLLLGLHAEPGHAGETEVPERAGAATAVPAASEVGACVESDTVLCLHEGRYEVTVEVTANSETTPAKVARPRTDDSGLFYFFDRNNWEMLLKVLDGCKENQHHWVFAATASDLPIRLVVRDTTLADNLVNLKEYSFKAIERRPQRPDESDEDYQKNVLAKGHPALTEVGAFPDACQASS